MGRPQPLKRPVQIGIIKSREIASKIANRIFNPTNRARLNRSLIPDIFF